MTLRCGRGSRRKAAPRDVRRRTTVQRRSICGISLPHTAVVLKHFPNTTFASFSHRYGVCMGACVFVFARHWLHACGCHCLLLPPRTPPPALTFPPPPPPLLLCQELRVPGDEALVHFRAYDVRRAGALSFTDLYRGLAFAQPDHTNDQVRPATRQPRRQEGGSRGSGRGREDNLRDGGTELQNAGTLQFCTVHLLLLIPRGLGLLALCFCVLPFSLATEPPGLRVPRLCRYAEGGGEGRGKALVAVVRLLLFPQRLPLSL